MRCVLRELRDEDLAVLFEQWADPVAAHMAAFTRPDHLDRDAFERSGPAGEDKRVRREARAAIVDDRQEFSHQLRRDVDGAPGLVRLERLTGAVATELVLDPDHGMAGVEIRDAQPERLADAKASSEE